nr:inositol 1,4,5-trisphosphate binding protein [rats, brain, Peptide Partial, 8 aa] [Rattus sp.]
TIWQESRK